MRPGCSCIFQEPMLRSGQGPRHTFRTLLGPPRPLHTSRLKRTRQFATFTRTDMNLDEFAASHLPALEADAIRFNVQISAITSAVQQKPAGFRHWSLGAPGHCAFQWPGRAIVL